MLEKDLQKVSFVKKNDQIFSYAIKKYPSPNIRNEIIF